jgi:hypothetical protein
LLGYPTSLDQPALLSRTHLLTQAFLRLVRNGVMLLSH